MTTGLALNWSLKKNLIIKKFHKAPFSKNGLLNQKAIDAYWDKCQKEYQIKANSGEDHEEPYPAVISRKSFWPENWMIIRKWLLPISRHEALISVHRNMSDRKFWMHVMMVQQFFLYLRILRKFCSSRTESLSSMTAK